MNVKTSCTRSSGLRAEVLTWSGITLCLIAVSGCTRLAGLASENLESRRDLLAGIPRGATTNDVMKVLGPPDEIRAPTETSTHFLGEAYRWVYGVTAPGEWPLVGVLVLASNNTVMASKCPSREKSHRKGAERARVGPGPDITASGMYCEVESVSNRPGDTAFFQRAVISLVNGGRESFIRKHERTYIKWDVVIEVYESHHLLIWREDRSKYESAYKTFADKAKWPTMVVNPGERMTEDLPIWIESYGVGEPSKGTYYLRVGFPFEENKFFWSSDYKFSVP